MTDTGENKGRSQWAEKWQGYYDRLADKVCAKVPKMFTRVAPFTVVGSLQPPERAA